MTGFKTTDLSLAAAVRTILRHSPSVRINGRLAEFAFQVDSTQAQQVADRYYSDDLSANLRTYAQDLRDLKSLIFAARERAE